MIMNFLVMTLGSIGDFFPFLAFADELRRRGHRVVLASNAGYAGLARMAGFEFSAIWERTDQSLDGLIAEHPARAWQAVRDQMLLPAIESSQNCIAHHTRGGEWTLLASWSVFAAAKAHDQSGLPLLKIYLSPGGLESDEDHRADAAGFQNLGLFPEWFAPGGIAQTGFVMLNDAVIPPLSDDLEMFLSAGPPPAIFTPGSFMRDAGNFFQQGLAACEQLGLRAVLLTPYPEQIPRALPSSALHVKFAPLQRLAPRSVALVHHGGIGTLAQGLKAGIPQLVMPLFFDQPDNAARLAQLGVSATVAPSDWRAGMVAEQLHALLQSEMVRQACADGAARFAQSPGVTQTCDLALALGK